MTTEAPKATGTEYVVLEMVTIPAMLDSDPDTVAWVEAGTAQAPHKNDAIKKVSGERGGTFKAVPESSWRGAVRTATKTVVTTEKLDL